MENECFVAIFPEEADLGSFTASLRILWLIIKHYDPSCQLRLALLVKINRENMLTIYLKYSPHDQTYH